MDIDPRYVLYVDREDSLFRKKCVYVYSVCWMDPWARIENIPANVESLDLYLYHAYLANFNMVINEFLITIAPQKVMTDAIWDPSLK